jgi:hypothetical protein
VFVTSTSCSVDICCPKKQLFAHPYELPKTKLPRGG